MCGSLNETFREPHIAFSGVALIQIVLYKETVALINNFQLTVFLLQSLAFGINRLQLFLTDVTNCGARHRYFSKYIILSC